MFTEDITIPFGSLGTEPIELAVQMAEFADGSEGWDAVRLVINGQLVEVTGLLGDTIAKALDDESSELSRKVRSALAEERQAARDEMLEDYSFDRRLELACEWRSA